VYELYKVEKSVALHLYATVKGLYCARDMN
jgi:hypothetical protein